jgi:hypothetical protein
MGYSFNKLSIAQNGGGLSRTACTQGAAALAALAQSRVLAKVLRRWATMVASGR